MSIRDAYTRWSETYDADPNRTRDLDAEVTREWLGGRRFRSILEIGCGTGKNTAFLTTVAERVTAVDFSPGMLQQAVAKAAASGFADRVEFGAVDVANPWPFAAAQFDLLVCNLVLEHIADLRFVFAEATRCLRPGGEFFACELHPFRQYEGTVANFSRNGETTTVAAFVHHLSAFWQAAAASGFALTRFDERWHGDDAGRPPRLAAFLFRLRSE
ncbi:MAG: class I SAM-dependent methyltransferase [Planctomycetaceae bacterium]|nr:class I SAM-dependent methyltransferase [Planctomycetaceae bacterium]